MPTLFQFLHLYDFISTYKDPVQGLYHGLRSGEFSNLLKVTGEVNNKSKEQLKVHLYTLHKRNKLFKGIDKVV